MNFQLVTPPASEPLELAEAKQSLKQDEIDVDDALILGRLRDARVTAETYTERQLVTASWVRVLDCFHDYEALCRGDGDDDGQTLELHKLPVQSVDAIKYYDSDGVLTTLPASDYDVDLVSEPVRVRPAPGKCWPATQARMNAVVIEFTAGYGDAEDVPDGIKTFLLARVGFLYANRGDQPAEEPEFLLGLLDDYRWR